MTDCPDADVRDLLPELAAGVLAADTRARVEAHLAGCAECRAELALMGAIRRAYARPVAIDADRVARALPEPTPMAASGLMEPARSGHPQAAARASRRYRTFGTPGRQLAAALALFAVGATSIWMASLSGSGSDAGSDSIASVAGEERAVTLGHRLGELTEQELEALLGELDGIDAIPALEPAQLIAPLGGGEGS